MQMFFKIPSPYKKLVREKEGLNGLLKSCPSISIAG